MTWGVWLLLAGVGCACLGGELFVRGTVGLARWVSVSPGIVAATVAAFATSSPEVAVAVSSALSGRPEIALGDALGSNVANVALILGIALSVAALKAQRSALLRDYSTALLLPLLLGLQLWDGRLSRIDCMLLLGLFVLWLVALLREAGRQRGEVVRQPETRRGRILVYCGVGLLLLVAAGLLIVEGARTLALALGISEFIIGATLVAVGTSTPELATTVVAKLRGFDDISLGTILGSNIFNGLLIVPLAATIQPITIGFDEIAPALGFGLLALIPVFPTAYGTIPRWRGSVLLLLCVGYVWILVG